MCEEDGIEPRRGGGPWHGIWLFMQWADHGHFGYVHLRVGNAVYYAPWRVWTKEHLRHTAAYLLAELTFLESHLAAKLVLAFSCDVGQNKPKFPDQARFMCQAAQKLRRELETPTDSEPEA